MFNIILFLIAIVAACGIWIAAQDKYTGNANFKVLFWIMWMALEGVLVFNLIIIAFGG